MSPKAPKAHARLSDEALDLVARRFKALSDPSRLKVCHELMDGECSVGELVERTGLTQSNVSRHLGLLRDEGIVARRADGQRAFYSIVDPSISRICETVCERLGEQVGERARSLRPG